VSIHKFGDDCPGCRPALFDAQTQRRFGPDTPEMKAVDALWAETTKQEREAFHRVTCQNSRTPGDLRLAGGVVSQIKNAILELKKQARGP